MIRVLRWRLFSIVVLALAGLATHGTYAGSGDEPHYLAITHSIAFDFDLDLANNYGTDEPLIGGGGLRPDMHALEGVGGVLRPVHDVGMPILFAPYARVMVPAVSSIARRAPPALMRRFHLTPSLLYRQAISGAMILIAATLAIVMFDVFMAFDVRPRGAFWTALLTALSPPLLIYSLLFFTELVSALLCIVLFRKIVLEQGGTSIWTWACAGAATGLLILVHIRNTSLAFVLATLAIYGLARQRALRQLGVFVTTFGGMVAVRTALNYHMWGTWVTSPHVRPGAWEGWTPILSTAAKRLAGMFLDQEYGLLPYAPVFVVAIFGFVAIRSTNGNRVLQLGAIVGSYLLAIALPVTNVHGWTGGWSPVARFLVPLVPLFAIGVAAGMRSTPRFLLVPLLVVQIGIDAYMWQHPKNLWNDGDGVAAVCSRGGAPGCGYLPSFVTTK